ncbi:MAG: DUF3667 domain-containing protein [Bacteroidales bacterium]|jgi:hypothetical protein|nr:DUF3667 domain-containing protein [Bacteroidales bacterium]
MSKEENVDINETINENKTYKCKNCGTEFTGTYCYNCGQKNDTERLTTKLIFKNFFSSFTNLDRGVLLTINLLFTNPGKLIKDYIEGKRVIYAKPFTMLIILSSIYGILYSFLAIISNKPIDVGLQLNPTDGDINWLHNLINSILNWAEKSVIIWSLLMIPAYALSSKIAFKKINTKGYNYAEILLACTFMACQRMFIDIIILPLDTFISDESVFDTLVTCTRYASYITLSAWNFKGLFNIKWKKSIIKTIYMYLLSFVFAVILIAVILLIFIFILIFVAWVTGQLGDLGNMDLDL